MFTCVPVRVPLTQPQLYSKHNIKYLLSWMLCIVLKIADYDLALNRAWYCSEPDIDIYLEHSKMSQSFFLNEYNINVI